MTTTPSRSLLTTNELVLGIDNRVLCRCLSVQMAAGQTWSLLGPNGSGKTTLLETLAGLRPVQSGQILLEGGDITSIQLEVALKEQKKETDALLGELLVRMGYTTEATVAKALMDTEELLK